MNYYDLFFSLGGAFIIDGAITLVLHLIKYEVKDIIKKSIILIISGVIILCITFIVFKANNKTTIDEKLDTTTQHVIEIKNTQIMMNEKLNRIMPNENTNF